MKLITMFEGGKEEILGIAKTRGVGSGVGQSPLLPDPKQMAYPLQKLGLFNEFVTSNWLRNIQPKIIRL